MKKAPGKWLLFCLCALLTACCAAEFALRFEGVYRMLRIWLRTVIGAGIPFADAIGYMGEDALVLLAPAFAVLCALFGLAGMVSAILKRRHGVMAAVSLLLMLLGLIPGRLLFTAWLEGGRYALLGVIFVLSLISLCTGKKKDDAGKSPRAGSTFSNVPDRHRGDRVFGERHQK